MGKSEMDDKMTDEQVHRILAKARGELPIGGDLRWRKPPWRLRKDDEDGWPYCGDHFLAAVAVVTTISNKWRWEFWVLHWTESGLEDSNGDLWGAWSEEDIEWIAEIPEPPRGNN